MPSLSALSILAVETATEACSAALYHDGKIASRFTVAPRQHAALILTQCDELLREMNILSSQLSAVAFGCGPGSFTGVRIAAAVAQGIAIAHDLPVISVSSLQALAQAAFLELGKEKVIAGMDARMQEIYTGRFIVQDNIMQLIDQEVVISPEKLKAPDVSEDWFYAGFAFQQENIIFPSAGAVIAIALQHWQENKIILPEKALPVYLRNKVVF
jgi:tRNA threonylcarbamoyladenosine biosynthesis protein TsaB